MTDFIRAEGLLAVAEIEAIIRHAPIDLIRFQDAAALAPVGVRPAMAEWLDAFNAGQIAA